MNNCDCNSTGGCLKCKPQKGIYSMKQSKEMTNWEKEFDKKFGYLQDPINTYAEDYFGCKEEKELEDIKSFISNLLSQATKDERSRIVGEIEKGYDKKIKEYQKEDYNLCELTFILFQRLGEFTHKDAVSLSLELIKIIEYKLSLKEAIRK